MIEYRFVSTRSKKELSNDKECLLEFLRYFDKKEGRAPKQFEFAKNSKYPSYASYYSWFGSWKDAIKEAGLLEKTEIVRERIYTDEELLESLRRFKGEEGRIPKQEDFVNNPKYPGFVTIVKWFGSWNNALKLSGLVNIFTNYTDEELLEFLIKFERKEGRIPRQEDFIGNPNCPSHNLYKSRFGSWNNAIKCAGLIPGQYISNEELLESLRRFKGEEGRIPKQEDFVNNPKYPGFMTIVKWFGSWNNALRLSGLVNIFTNYTDE